MCRETHHTRDLTPAATKKVYAESKGETRTQNVHTHTHTHTQHHFLLERESRRKPPPSTHTHIIYTHQRSLHPSEYPLGNALSFFGPLC